MDNQDQEYIKVSCFVIGPVEECLMEYENVIHSYLELHLQKKFYGKLEQPQKIAMEGRASCFIKMIESDFDKLEEIQINKNNVFQQHIFNFFKEKEEVIFENGRLSRNFYILNIPTEREMTGAYGEILMVQNKIDKNIYVIKKRKEDVYNKNKLNIQMIQNLKYIREASNMMKLSHPHLVRAYDWWLERSHSNTFHSENSNSQASNITENSNTSSFSREDHKFSLYILMEYVGELGKAHNLFSYTKEVISKIPDFLPKRKLIHKYFMQILTALVYLHESGYVHRDIKPENIFVDQRKEICKIGDFGFSKLICQENKSGELKMVKVPSSCYGTICYQPPEMRLCFDRSGDLYNLGLVLFDMCNNMHDRKKSHYNLTYQQSEAKFPLGFTENFKEESLLIEVLCNEIPEKRENYIEHLRNYNQLIQRQ